MKKTQHNVSDHAALRFLAWICPSKLYEGIEGDLIEAFDHDVKKVGEKIARRRLVWNAITFCRPGILMRHQINTALINTIMLNNYLKVAARNVLKRKLYSSINAFGLSIGITFCILIYLYIRDEKSFDTFHANGDRIYRLEQLAYQFFNTQIPEKERYVSSASMTVGFRQALVDELPEVEYATRYNEGGAIVKRGMKVFREDVVLVDPDFFKMFSFPIIAGNADSILYDTHEIVITPKIAVKYFGDEDPLGKVLTLDYHGDKDFIVSAIVQDPPANSSISFDILLSQRNRFNHDQEMSNWGNFNTPTLVQLRTSANQKAFEKNVDKVVQKFMGKQIADWKREGKVPEHISLFKFSTSPLVQWHMKSNIPWHKVSNPKYSYILGGLAILILLIACINYISLALATSASRRVEVGIRKVTGALSKQLMFQFGFESIFLAVLSMLAGMVLLMLVLPVFNSYTGKSIAINTFDFIQLLGIGLLLAFAIGVLAGGYPAFVVSNLRPALILKGRFTSKIRAAFSRPLVVLQFGLSAFLLISAMIMYRQMQYVANKDLGYDRHNIIVLRTQAGWSDASDAVVKQFRSRLMQEPEITSVSGTSSSFNWGFSETGFNINGENRLAYTYTVDPNYVPILNLKILMGRNFDESNPSDSNAVLVNEALVKDLKWKDPLNEYLNWQNYPDSKGAKVIGVVKDYNNLSLESAIKPLLLSIDTRSRHLMSMLIKVHPGATRVALDKIEKAWKSMYPDRIFEYTFMDEDVARQYESHQRWLDIMKIATGLAILISCLGLFGMAGINAVNRTKEIGIRKVMGAGVRSLFMLLNKEYILLWIISFVVAIPLSAYVMQDWLSGFTFRIEMGWSLFVVSMLAGLIIALVTVSYHTVKASRINPAETLKYE